MAAKLKQGDAVVIASREQTAADVKSGLYYGHYAGLRGTILKLYGEEASIAVDRDSLPSDIRVRHEEGEKGMRQKWLDNLSEEARGRLNEGDKKFALNYAVLVSVNDLAPDRGAAKRAADVTTAAAPRPSAEEKREAKAVAQAAQSLDPLSGESDVQRARKRADGASESGTDSAARRLSAADLDRQEEAFLAARRAQADGKPKNAR